jgi:CBS domain-containing protein
VLADGVYVGMLGRADLVRGLRETGADATVATVMATRGPVVTVADHPEAALTALHDAGGRAVPVLRDGAVVGLLTTENLAEYVLLSRRGS